MIDVSYNNNIQNIVAISLVLSLSLLSKKLNFNNRKFEIDNESIIWS